MQIRRTIAAAALACVALVLNSCAGDDLAEDGGGDSGNGAVVIASQNFTEAILLGNMYELLLDDAGFSPELKLVGDRSIYCCDAANKLPQDIDVAPEYLSSFANELNAQANGDAEPVGTNDVDETKAAADELASAVGITLLDVAEATDANAYYVSKEYAEKNDVSALSDLKGQNVVLAAAEGCPGRSDCEQGLIQTYGINVTKVLPTGFGGEATAKSVLDGESQLGQTATTDGTLESQGLVMLEDDKGIVSAENLIPAVSSEFVDAHPEAADVLNELMSALTTETVADLNRRVDVEREKAEDVAKEFLEDEGLLG